MWGRFHYHDPPSVKVLRAWHSYRVRSLRPWTSPCGRPDGATVDRFVDLIEPPA
jgi:hypothetical protein